MTNIEPSVSSRVVNHLRDGMAVDALFTCYELCLACGLPETDHGAVSGTLSRARKAGLVEFVHINAHGAYTYRVADRNVVMTTRAVRGQGSKAGAARKWRKEYKGPRVAKPAHGIPGLDELVQAKPAPPEQEHTFDYAEEKPIGFSTTQVLDETDTIAPEVYAAAASYVAPAPSHANLVALLLDAAAMAETLAGHVTLENASKEQLLAELGKRLRD